MVPGHYIIDNEEINGGSSISASIAIWNDKSSPLIQNNYIYGGTGTNSGGIDSESNSQPVINANTIHGGSPTTQASGVSMNTSAAKIWNNTIFGGNGSSLSLGIMSWFTGASLIQNNTIDGGTSSTSRGIYLSSGSTPVIQNNIIFVSGGVSRCCIYEANDNGYANKIGNNDLWDTGSTLYYRDYNGIWYNDIADVNDISLTHTNDNVDSDPIFVDINGQDGLPETMDDNDWHPTSPLVSIRYGAIDLSLTFKTDKDGKTRTGNGAIGWSMGAYEY